MNERIRELAEQAENYAREQNDKFGLSYKREYDKKFAELIVKEACQHLTNTGQDYARELVEKHFGVK